MLVTQPRALTGYDWSVFDAADLVLADLDGCLISGATVLDGVSEFVARYSDKLAVVSNNSQDTADSLTARLAKLGLSVPAHHIFLAGEQTVRQLAAEHPRSRIVVYGSSALKQLATDCGLHVDSADAQPERVLLARDTSFTFTDLADLMALSATGVPVWVTNPDPSHPRADGVPVPETGALWAAVSAATNTTPERLVGKPTPLLLTLALTHFGTTAEHAVMIGDTAVTDGAAADAAGVRFLHVDQRTSETSTKG